MADRRHLLRWAGMIALSVALVVGLELLRLPAALLLGAMVAAIVFAGGGARLTVAAPLFYVAQAVVGCMIAQAMPLALLGEVMRDWPIFVTGVISVIAASALLGWLLSRLQVLPGTTAIWGSSPGAATVMMLLAGNYGADMRLVAFMQYLRVVVVAVAATTVARFWTTVGPGGAPPIDWLAPVDPLAFAETLAIVAAGTLAGAWLRLPAGPLLLPMVLAVVLQDLGLVVLVLPPWLLAPAYALIGWAVGGRFDRAILRHAAGALPAVLGSILCLVAACGGLAAILVFFAGIDPLTAYLATSPGGADSVAIIAASSPVDVPFVMAMQTTRLILVLLTGPALARLIANHAVRQPSTP